MRSRARGRDPREGVWVPPRGLSGHIRVCGHASACLAFVSEEGAQARSPGGWQGRKVLGQGLSLAGRAGRLLELLGGQGGKWPLAWPRRRHC